MKEALSRCSRIFSSADTMWNTPKAGQLIFTGCGMWWAGIAQFTISASGAQPGRPCHFRHDHLHAKALASVPARVNLRRKSSILVQDDNIPLPSTRLESSLGYRAARPGESTSRQGCNDAEWRLPTP